MAWVLFFDGDCGFCSASVRRVAKLDPKAKVDFAPLQGKLAAEHALSRYAENGGGTLVLLRESDGQSFFRSDALIELARVLGGLWRLATLARWIPRPLRDGVYRWIARNRHRLPGSSQQCQLPDPELRRRMRE